MHSTSTRNCNWPFRWPLTECQLISLVSQGPTGFGCPLKAGSEGEHESPTYWRSPH
jgi:hypothetical protein